MQGPASLTLVGAPGRGPTVHLEGGRLLTHVHPGALQAGHFIITAPGAEIRVTGTIFEVRHRPEGVSVSVARGAVEVRRGAAATVPVKAGQHLPTDGQRAKPRPEVDEYLRGGDEMLRDLQGLEAP